LRFAEVDLRGPERSVVFAQNANLSRSPTGIFPWASRRLVSLHYRPTDDAALRIAQLLLQLFFQLLHLLAEIARLVEIPMPIVVSSRNHGVTLWHFFFGKLSGDLLLLALAQDCERHLCAFRESLQQPSQLARFDQNLVVQHLEDVVLLDACRRGRAVRLHIIDDQPKACSQTEQFTDYIRHLRCLYTDICHRDLRRLFVNTWHARHPWWMGVS